MAAYYSVKVRVRTVHSDTGKVKEHIEPYIVSAETPEDAAFKTREYYGAESRDYTVESVSATKYIAVID